MIHKKISVKIGEHHPTAEITTYMIGNSEELYDGRLRPLIIICPGGGYEMTSDREAEGIALKYMAMGYHAAVLRYSVKPAVYPTALLQLAATVKYFRENSDKYYIDADKIIICGFSAGGHLVASYGNSWNKAQFTNNRANGNEVCRPNAQILCYPVISSGKYGHKESIENLLGDRFDELNYKMSMEKYVNNDTPQTFIWHCFDDETVPVENSLMFATALRQHNIPTELHVFAGGAHGIGTAGELTMSSDGYGVVKECECWMDLANAWIRNI